MKILFLVLLFYVGVSAQENDNTFLRGKAILSGKMTEVKFLLKSDLISHLTVNAKKKTLYEITINPYLCENRIFQFNVDEMNKGDIIEFIAVDNRNVKHIQKIKVTDE